MPIRGPDVLLVDRRPKDHYAILTVNREERANSFNIDLSRRLAESWAALSRDDDIWAVILTAVGDRYFCTGDDLKDMAEMNETYEGGFWAYVHDQGGFGNMSPLGNSFWKPIIGAINGYSLAGGWYLGQMCDVRIAADHAMFGIPEVRWNLPAPFAAQLQRMIPAAIALEMALWGSRQYTAQRMYEVGFVNKVVPKDQLMPEAIRWAHWS